MVNPYEVALTRIMYSIPKTILRIAFYEKTKLDPDMIAIEDLIKQNVIRKRVMVDLNLLGGKPKTIVLEHRYLEKIQRNTADGIINTGQFSLYRIPPEEREYRPIIECTGITYPGRFGGSLINATGYGGGVTMGSLAAEVLNSHTLANSPARPMAEALSGELVRLTPAQHAHIDWVLSVRLAYDTELTNLSSSQIDTFSKICVAATKYYVYNELIIDIERGRIEAGYDLSSIRDVINSYSDQNDRYMELLDDMAGAACLDPIRMATILRYQI